MRTAIYALLATALVLLGVGVATAADYLFPASTENPITQSGCVIRFDQKTSSGNTSARIHANSAHYCVGAQGVSTSYTSGDLVIKLHTVGPIVSIAVSPDETLTSRGISCGASGGMGTISIRCYDRYGLVKAYSRKMYGVYSNLWVGWTSWQL